MREYDYIVSGSGAAGLSLLMHLIRCDQLNTKRILVVDREEKNRNDRTWCFWEKGPGLFEPVVYKSWNLLNIYSPDGELINQSIEPYTYKLIRGIDYYQFCFESIRTYPNIEFIQGEVQSMQSGEHGAVALINGESFRASYIFNSILFEKPAPSRDIYFLQQHFKGWFIKCTRNLFDATTATLMDFRVSQDDGTSFLYVMPFSSSTALIEYTVFSPQILTAEKYDTALKKYCAYQLQLSEDEYAVMDTEAGVIPMTNFPFKGSDGNIINIGTAGGRTKGSSGYTFNFIHKQSAEIVRALGAGTYPGNKIVQSRHQFYDNVLLNILAGKKMEGAEIFSRLFRKNRFQDVLKFLDNDTGLLEDIQIIAKLPVITFSKAALNHLIRH